MRTAIACFLALLVGGFLYLSSALNSEERVSSAYHLFPNVVIRSLLLQGREMRSAHETIEGRVLRDQLLSQIRAAVETRDRTVSECTLPVDISGYGFDETIDTFSAMLGARPIRFVVFFMGEVPDIGPYLDPRQNTDLLAPYAHASGDSAFLQTVLSADFRRDFRVLYPRGEVGELSWIGVRCERYSAIVIEVD